MAPGSAPTAPTKTASPALAAPSPSHRLTHPHVPNPRPRLHPKTVANTTFSGSAQAIRCASTAHSDAMASRTARARATNETVSGAPRRRRTSRRRLRPPGPRRRPRSQQHRSRPSPPVPPHGTAGSAGPSQTLRAVSTSGARLWGFDATQPAFACPAPRSRRYSAPWTAASSVGSTACAANRSCARRWCQPSADAKHGASVSAASASRRHRLCRAPSILGRSALDLGAWPRPPVPRGHSAPFCRRPARRRRPAPARAFRCRSLDATVAATAPFPARSALICTRWGTPRGYHRQCRPAAAPQPTKQMLPSR